MNKSYCDEVLENLTTFVTVGYAIRERRDKQRIAFLAVKDHLLRATKLSLKGT